MWYTENMQATREQILSYLQNHPPSSAEEISRYLEMTKANIRYHLDILEEEGFVRVSGKRPAGGIGRPILLYSLTAFSLGDNLIPLLGAMLSELNESPAREQTLSGIAEHCTKGSFKRKLNRIQRFNRGVEFLNKMHYHASWEARPKGPRVVLRHCPYQDLAQTHPILCQVDENLLQAIFGPELHLIEKRDFEKNPFSPCIFQAE